MNNLIYIKCINLLLDYTMFFYQQHNPLNLITQTIQNSLFLVNASNSLSITTFMVII